MLDVGFSEILLTSAIALIVLGPERLPKVARRVGNWMGRARVMARQLTEQLEREVNAEEFLKAQIQPNPAANAAAGGGDPAQLTSAPPASVAPPPAAPPEPVYGAPAEFTTPAAMHANDPPAAQSPIAAPTTTAADANPPHE